MSWTPVAHAAAGGSTTIATTSAIDTTGANFIAVVASYYASGGQPPISDSYGNTPTGLLAQEFGTGNRIYYYKNPTVGTGHTFTLGDGTTTTFPSLAVLALSGADITSPSDVQNGGAGTTSSTTLQPGSATPGSAGEIVITGISPGSSSGSLSVDSGFTITDTAYGAAFGVALAYLIQTAATAENPTWTIPAGAFSPTVTIATFKAGASGPATTYTAPASPTTMSLGTATVATVTPNGTYTGTITGTPSGSASTGLSAIVKTFSGSATPQTASWTPTVTGTLTITWTNSGSLTNPGNDTVTVSSAALTAGAVSFDSGGPAGGSAFIKMTATDATNGTPNGSPPLYAYQWASSVDGGSFSNLSNGSGVSGATTRTLTDGSATSGHTYKYQLSYTDSAGSPATVASAASPSLQVYTGGIVGGGGSVKSGQRRRGR